MPWAWANTFTQADLDAGNVTYDHDDSETTSDSFGFSLADGGEDGATAANGTFNITITPVNDAPTFSTTNSTPSFTENGGAVNLFSGTSIDAIETGDLIDTLVISVDSIADGNDEILMVDGQAIELTHLNNETTATGGYDVSVSVSGSTATVTITKTGGYSAAAAESLVDGLAYNNTSESPQGAVRLVTLISIKDDGGTSNGGADTKGIGIASLVNITPVNDAPTITDAFSVGLPGGDEDSATAGTTVTAIVDNAGWNDPDAGALRGMAVTGMTGNGTWQYSTDAVTWTSFGSVSATNALLLDATTQVRYVGDGIDGEVANFTFRGWDTTTDTASTNGSASYANPGAGGGTTAYSSQSASASATITSVNDEQTLVTNTGTTVAEGSSGTVITTAMLETTDIDNTAGQITYTLTGIPSNGVLRRSGANLSVSSTFTQADVDAGIITYLHNDTETASDSFSFTVDDAAGASSSGTFNITITPVNDNDPVITSDGGGATAAVNVVENSSSVTTVVASDADLPAATVTYSIIGGADSTQFSIDGNTGALTFVASPNYESPTDSGGNNVYDVIVQASDGTRTDSQAIAVTVTDSDEFDVGAVSDVNATANAVGENAIAGTAVGITASASDNDGTTNTITYSLQDDDGGRFAIDSSSGVVTVNGAIDRETDGASRNITVRATSSDSSFTDQVFSIAINDVDEFNVGSVSDTDGDHQRGQ